MGAPDRLDVAEAAVDGPEVDRAIQDHQAKGGRLRRLLTGGVDDEFTENVRPLSSAQREQLTRATDELMKRYSVSRAADPSSEDEAEGEPLSADELGAVLQTVLAEVFDFGWFTRPDLPWAPELDYESSTDPDHAGTADLERIRAQDPPALRVVDLSSEPEIALLHSEPAADEADELGPDDAVVEEPAVEEPAVEEPVVEEPVLLEPVVDEPVVSEPVVEDRIVQEPVVAVPVVENRIVEEPVFERHLVDGRVNLERSAAERMAIELEAMLMEAVAAEREAILFAAATRERLQSAKAVLAALDAEARQHAESVASHDDGAAGHVH